MPAVLYFITLTESFFAGPGGPNRAPVDTTLQVSGFLSDEGGREGGREGGSRTVLELDTLHTLPLLATRAARRCVVPSSGSISEPPTRAWL